MIPIKVGLLTTWNTQCGIAEYSRYIALELRKHDDIDLIVLGSRNYDERKVGTDEEFVYPVFDVQPWNRYGYHGLDVEYILNLNLDVLHVQYEVLLYEQQKFLQLLTEFKGLKVITYHDNCIPVGFPYHLFGLRYTHRESVGVGEGFVLPMGVENRKPIIKTFGLGRSREDIIAEISLRNNWIFQKSFGEQTWRPQNELYSWLRDSDAIILYYEDVPSAGSSIAARVAISTRRPVYVNDVTWFAEFDPKLVPNLTKVADTADLETTLQKDLENTFIKEHDWKMIVNTIVEDYKQRL